MGLYNPIYKKWGNVRYIRMIVTYLCLDFHQEVFLTCGGIRPPLPLGNRLAYGGSVVFSPIFNPMQGVPI